MLPDNINVFPKWNYVEAHTQPGYTIFFGNWGTYYSNMTKDQLLYFYKTLLKNSLASSTFGDLYIYFEGKLIRSINKQDGYREYIRTKNLEVLT